MPVQHSHLSDSGCGYACSSVSGACGRPASWYLCQPYVCALGCDPATSLQACKAADDLKANLEEEYVAVRTFIVEFCKCMDHIQHAKMLVSGCEHPSCLPVL